MLVYVLVLGHGAQIINGQMPAGTGNKMKKMTGELGISKLCLLLNSGHKHNVESTLKS